jgi:hypothetical protein
MALLVVHGLLHLLGHDHEDSDEAEAMESKERALLSRHHASAAVDDGGAASGEEVAPSGEVSPGTSASGPASADATDADGPTGQGLHP